MLGEHGCVGGHGKVTSKVELLDEKVQDMARLVEVTMEVLVETDDWTSGSAAWMESDSSFFPSYKVHCPLRSELRARHVLRVQQC